VWAQLMKLRITPGAELVAVADLLKSFEQPDSGLIRETFMQAQDDPETAYVLVVFESEERARERERDPRRADGQLAMREALSGILAAPPEFTDLTVAVDWIV